jgi:glutamate/tyrosine decarboxylase-like PLP-dependent enzyme
MGAKTKEHAPMSDRDEALDRAHRHAVAYLESLGERAVWPTATYDEMRRAFDVELTAEGVDAPQVVDDLARLAERGLNASSSGRFYGFVFGGTLPSALAADWLTSAWDQNVGLTQATPAAAAAEAVAGDWIVDLLGLPSGSGVGFVTGGQMANFAGLAAARHAVLARAGCDLKASGLRNAPRITLVVGRFRHGTIDRAAAYLGLGSDDRIDVDADDEGRMLPAALEEVMAAVEGPSIVCLQAGEVHTGAFDPFPELIDTAHRHDAWVHVDGAFGLWAGGCARTRHLVDGVAGADSWATDGHKTLNVPYDSGFAIVRDPAALAAVFAVSADYLIDGVGDPLDRTPEFSRRGRGFAAWAALRSLGRAGVDNLVGGLCDRAVQMSAGLREIPGVEVLNDVVFTQVVASFGDDEATRLLGERLRAEGTAVLTPGVWRGKAVLRCSFSDQATTSADVDATLAAIRRLMP